MPDIVSNAMLILRCLYEASAISAGSVDIKGHELIAMTGLSEAEVDAADTYLLEARLVEGTNGLAGSRWLTPAGVERHLVEVTKRIPTSLVAEKIARFVADKTADPAHPIVTDKVIQENLQLDDVGYRKACQELADRGLLKDQYSIEQKPYAGVVPTPAGRNAVRDDFQQSTAVFLQQNVGAIFHGPVSDSNVQAVAVAANSNIQQAISRGDIATLRTEISQLIEKLVDVVKPELGIEQLAAYANAAKQLKDEVQKPEPDPSLIQRLLGLLGFAGDLDGAIELGKKGLELAVKIGPLLFTLQQAILQLM